MKKGILVVSFGTSHLDTMEKTIAAMEREIQEKYPDRAVYRAFTSRIIIRKLELEESMHIDTVAEALERMAHDGVTDVIVQPTHMINGIENDNMLADLRSHQHLFERIRTGMPLLSSTEDYENAIHAVMQETKLEGGETLVLMGHGTDHYANASYPALEYTFHLLGYENVFVGTVEGFPELSHVMTKLERTGAKKVTLMPFMLVAGDHAKNDMAGDEDSWRQQMEEKGYEVNVLLRGLGELQGIRDLFIEHVRDAAPIK